MAVSCTFLEKWLKISLKCYFLFSILFKNVYHETFNFVKTGKPCCKEGKASEKTLPSYLVRSKKYR